MYDVCMMFKQQRCSFYNNIKQRNATKPHSFALEMTLSETIAAEI